MRSRYDFMQEGNVADEVSGSKYPDPLSLNYLNFELKDTPKKDVMTPTKITHLWKESVKMYGEPQWDDIVLTLNGVSHKNFLNPNDELYYPSEDDILASFTKERSL